MNVTQAAFRAAVLDPGQPRPDGLTDGKGHPAGRRFDVYRNNVAVSLIEAMETAFPVIAKLLGQNNFRILAGAFLRQHPPSSPLMMFYGDTLPEYLAEFEPTSKIGYLPDIARLELALRESYHAADADPLDPRVLQEIAIDDLMCRRVALAPSVRLVRSRWPIHAIWRFNTESDAPKPAMASEDVMIARPDLDPVPNLLPAGGGAFVSALLERRPLGEAIEIATADDDAFELSTLLALLLQTNAITLIGDPP